MNQQTVYQTVSVQDELPTEAGVYTCYKGEIVGRANFAPEHGFFDTPDGKVIVPIRADYYTHWEKPTTGYFFTPEEFERVINTAMWAAGNGADFQTFYNQLTGKTTKEVLDNDTTPPKWGTAL